MMPKRPKLFRKQPHLWSVSDDGLVYTFNIRTDIPWVYHNPVTGETTQAMRPVTDDAGEVDWRRTMHC